MHLRSVGESRDSAHVHARECTEAERAKLALAGAPILDRLRARFLVGATAQGAKGHLPQGVRWWIKFCVYGKSSSPIREVDEQSTRAEKLLEEQLLIDFAVWLVTCRPSGRHISPKTAMKYVYEIQGWASRLPVGGGRVGGGINLDRLKGVIKGMERLLGAAAHNPRFGVRTQDLAAALKQKLGGGSAAEANWRAALTTAFCALMRGGEFGVADGESWSATVHLSRADVTFYRDAEGVLCCVLMMRPLKKKAGQRKSVPVVLRSGGTFIDPVRELWEMCERDPLCAGEAPESRPLFRDTASGVAFRVSGIRRMVKCRSSGSWRRSDSIRTNSERTRSESEVRRQR